MNIENDFFHFMNQSTSPYQVVEYGIEMLEKEGFKGLTFDSKWDLQKGGAYYVKLYDTTLYAFKIGKNAGDDMMFRIAAAHTDSPCFRVKPNPVMREKSYIRLNTEAYGGMIVNSWFDRPLSMSGKVSLKSNQLFQPKELLINIERPLLVIPNLAIHLNRDVNKGIEVNKQTDVLPLLGMSDEVASNYFNQLLAEELQISAEDILSYDLYIYNTENAKHVGANHDFIFSPRLDDLCAVYALLQGIISDVSDQDIHLICLFDNEEIGNQTKQGCESQFTSILLEKIMDSFGKSRLNLYEVISRSFVLSVDVAQAFHPNFTSKYDPTNYAEINKGIVLKIDTSHKYAFDTSSIAIIQELCEINNIPYQKFVNRSDTTGGTTMSPRISTTLSIRAMDIGVPILAMHAASETIGSKDQESMIQLIKAYFSSVR